MSDITPTTGPAQPLPPEAPPSVPSTTPGVDERLNEIDKKLDESSNERKKIIKAIEELAKSEAEANEAESPAKYVSGGVGLSGVFLNQTNGAAGAKSLEVSGSLKATIPDYPFVLKWSGTNTFGDSYVNDFGLNLEYPIIKRDKWHILAVAGGGVSHASTVGTEGAEGTETLDYTLTGGISYNHKGRVDVLDHSLLSLDWSSTALRSHEISAGLNYEATAYVFVNAGLGFNMHEGAADSGFINSDTHPESTKDNRYAYAPMLRLTINPDDVAQRDPENRVQVDDVFQLMGAYKYVTDEIDDIGEAAAEAHNVSFSFVYQTTILPGQKTMAFEDVANYKKMPLRVALTYTHGQAFFKGPMGFDNRDTGEFVPMDHCEETYMARPGEHCYQQDVHKGTNNLSVDAGVRVTLGSVMGASIPAFLADTALDFGANLNVGLDNGYEKFGDRFGVVIRGGLSLQF
ncbi:MAG: hypothetical protein HQM16_11725 [Deltaproteobacteria bacterium]|nr:hypothetical protein [Deltaproteobacteria bacterium]